MTSEFESFKVAIRENIEERDAAIDEVKRRQTREKINNIIERKEDASLESKTIDELKDMLKDG